MIFKTNTLSQYVAPALEEIVLGVEEPVLTYSIQDWQESPDSPLEF